MSAPLLEIKVRPDWQRFSQRMAAERLRNWRAAEVAIVLASLLALLLSLLATGALWVFLARLLLITAVFWLIPLTFIYRTRLPSGRFEVQLADAAILLAVAAGLVFLSSPVVTSLLNMPFLAVLALAVPLITWPWLARSARRFPAPARQVGLTGDHWFPNLIVGISAGLVLGLHMLITGLALFPAEARPETNAATLLWLICAWAGLRAVGEELFFRGWSYHLLVREAHGSIWNAAGKITLLNLLVYTVFAASASSVIELIWILAYGALISLTNIALRHRFRSLLPGMACNVIATVFLALVIGT